MKHIDILNDRITVNQINGKTEAVAALREVREVIQALPATGEAARVAELEDAARRVHNTLRERGEEIYDLRTERHKHLKRLEELEGKLASVSADFEYAQQAVDNVLRLLPDRTTDSWEDAVNGWLKETDTLRADLDAALAEVERLKRTTVPVEVVIRFFYPERRYGSEIHIPGYGCVLTSDFASSKETIEEASKHVDEWLSIIRTKAEERIKAKEAQG